MKAFNFDLSKFKKASEDTRTTTLKSPEGHMIVVMHSKLPPMMREQLKRLKLADGGRVQKLDDGTPDGPLQVEPANPNDSDQPKQLATNPDQSHTTNVYVSSAPGQPAQNAAPMAAPAQLNGLGPVSETPPSPNLLRPDQTINAPGQLALGQQAVGEQQAIDTAKGAQAANIERGYNQQAQAFKNRDAENIAELKGHTDAFNEYQQANPINAHHWAETQSTGQKIANAFGLLAGGFKQGFSGGSNPAMDFINEQINRDIDAQKARNEQQRTVWGAYQNLYGDQNIANNLAKTSLMDMYKHQFNQLAAQFATPQAKQAADMLNFNLGNQQQQLLLDSAGRLGQLQMGSAQPGNPTNEMGQSTARIDRIITPEIQRAYNGLKWDTVHTPEQKTAIANQYDAGIQVDKALDQIDSLYPQLREKATWGGQLANHINPHAFGLAGAALGEAGAAAGTGGASLLAAAPIAALGAGAGELVGHGIKGAAQLAGGQKEIQYQTGKDSLKTMIGSALAGAKLTPTEISDIAEQFAPTKWDSDETARDKLEKLKRKIISITHTSALGGRK